MEKKDTWKKTVQKSPFLVTLQARSLQRKKQLLHRGFPVSFANFQEHLFCNNKFKGTGAFWF